MNAQEEADLVEALSEAVFEGLLEITYREDGEPMYQATEAGMAKVREMSKP